MQIQYTQKDIKRFWDKVAKTDNPNDCWEWRAKASTNFGYGSFHFGHRTLRAHRISWELANGPIPNGAFICHKCDNPKCVNPNHLFLGNNLENVHDAIAKARHSHGENHYQAKLTDLQVVEMRERYAKGGITHEQLAMDYGINRRLASQIIDGHTWKHLPIMQHISPRKRKGEGVHGAILTAEQVVEIRTSYKPFICTRCQLAHRFNVSKATIDAILQRRIWKHIP